MFFNHLNLKTSKRGRGLGRGGVREAVGRESKQMGWTEAEGGWKRSVWHELPTADKEHHATGRETMRAQRERRAAAGLAGKPPAQPPAPNPALTPCQLTGSQQLLHCGETHSHFLAKRISTVLIRWWVFFFFKIRNNTSPLTHSPDTAVFSTITRTNTDFWFLEEFRISREINN